MPLTVGEWRDLVRERLQLSKLWAVKADFSSAVLPTLRELASGKEVFVDSCSPLPYEPYCPFFSLLRQLQKKQNYDVETLLDESNVYTLHRGLFEAMYEGKPIYRDILFLEELSFEEMVLEDALKKQLAILSSQREIVWVVTDAQFLTKKSMRIFRSLFEENTLPIQVFLVWGDATQEEDILDFWEYLVQEGLAYEVSVPQGQEEVPSEKKAPSVRETFASVRILLQFLHFEEALLLLDDIQSEVFLSEDEIMLCFLRGLAYYYRREFQKAIEEFHNGLEKSFDIGSEEQSRNFQFYLGLSYFAQGDVEQAYKHSYVVYHQYYVSDRYETFGFIFYYILIALQYHGHWTSELENLVQQALAEAERWKFYNMKAYILGVYFMENIQTGFVEAKKQFLFQLCDEMIALGEKLQNQARLAAAYHNKAMVLSQLGQHEEAFSFYFKSLSLKERFQNPLELAQIRNGIAYGYILAEQYNEAMSFLQQNINSMRIIGNPIENLLSLVNVATVLFGSAQYAEAVEVLQTLEKMKRIVGIPNLPYHSSVEIGCYLGISYAKLHQSLKLLGMYERLKSMTEHQNLSAYEQLLWILFQAYYLREENKRDELRLVLQQWLSLLSEYRPTLRLLWREGAQLFFDVFPEKSPEREMMARIVRQLVERGIVSSDIITVVENPYHSETVTLFWSKDECLAIAHEFAAVQKLEQNLRRMHFLRQVYSIMANTSLSSHLFQKILKVISSYLPVSSAFFLLVEDFHWQVMASVNDTHVFDPVFVIEKVFRELSPEEKIVNLSLRPYWENLLSFEAFLYVVPLRRRYTWEGALILLWNRSFPMTRDHEEILGMLGEYLAVQLSYKRILDNLKFLNYDINTGFYKGEEVVEQCRKESARIERYGKKLRNFALVYVMLENFFHFREKYGDTIANLFLKRFRQYLERSVREVDTVGYMPEGGVVILLPESHAENAERFVKRLEAFFVDPLKDMKDVQKLLPQEKSRQEVRVSCHVGIVDYMSFPDAAENLVHVAKEMALRARANGTLKEVYVAKRP